MENLIQHWNDSHRGVVALVNEDMIAGLLHIQMRDTATNKRITRDIEIRDIQVSLLLVLSDMLNQMRRELKSYPEL